MTEMPTIGRLMEYRIPIRLKGKLLYKRNQKHPVAIYLGQNGDFHYTDPPNLFKPYSLYMHPYFPKEPVVRVEIVQAIPFASRGAFYNLNTVESSPIAIIERKRLAVSINDIYRYPQYFKPVYAFQIESDFREIMPFKLDRIDHRKALRKTD